MNLPITADQLKNYADEYTSLITWYGRNEAEDKFAKEWNETLIEFADKSKSRLGFRYGLEELCSRFDEYERSPLNRFCRFKEFYEILDLSDQEIEKGLKRAVGDQHDYYYGREDSELADVKEIVLKIVEVSRSADEIHLSVRQLFTHLGCCRRESEQRDHFKEYLSKLPTTKDVDVVNLVKRGRGIMDQWDDLRSENDPHTESYH